MNTTSHQAVQAAERAISTPEASPNRATRQHIVRAAMATATIAIGAALTALVMGVTGGTDTEPSPSPGVSPRHGNELPPDFIDPQLGRLAGERAAVPPDFIDPQLGRLAGERAAVRPEFIDPQLGRLAEQWAASQPARKD